MGNKSGKKKNNPIPTTQGEQKVSPNEELKDQTPPEPTGDGIDGGTDAVDTQPAGENPTPDSETPETAGEEGTSEQSDGRDQDPEEGVEENPESEEGVGETDQQSPETIVTELKDGESPPGTKEDEKPKTDADKDEDPSLNIEQPSSSSEKKNEYEPKIRVDQAIRVEARYTYGRKNDGSSLKPVIKIVEIQLEEPGCYVKVSPDYAQDILHYLLSVPRTPGIPAIAADRRLKAVASFKKFNGL